MHNIEHRTYDEKCDKQAVKDALDKYVAYEDRGEGCSGLYKPIRWIEKAGIQSDYDAACKYLELYDRHDYDNLAVRYYEFREPEGNNKKITELKDRIKTAWDRYCGLDRQVWAQSVTSEYVGCKHCGSRLKRSYIRANVCPVCRGDLRPETTINRLASLKNSHEKAMAALDDYKKTHGKKLVKWLLKFEYHT